MPKVSIIVPIYNVEKYLNKCIDSIINQTFTDFECILVDDGSTDNCGQICDEYAKKDKRIKVIHKQNGGLSSSRNAGIEVSKGEYIYFLDGDDFIENISLERLVSTIEASKTDAVTFNFQLETLEGEVKSRSHFEAKEYVLNNEKDRFDFICKDVLPYKIGWEACFKLYKGNIIRDNKLMFYDNSKIYAEDLSFFLHYVLESKSIKVIDDILYHCVNRETSITRSNKETKINEFVNLNYEYYCCIKEKGLNYFLKNYYIMFYRIMCDRYYQSDPDKVLRDMLFVQRKSFLKKNLIKLLINNKKVSEYLEVNNNSLIYENFQYYMHLSNNFLFKTIRHIMKK